MNIILREGEAKERIHHRQLGGELNGSTTYIQIPVVHFQYLSGPHSISIAYTNEGSSSKVGVRWRGDETTGVRENKKHQGPRTYL